jgi:CelD/BcsL family acetyltransferase involved in cellulose biosynthesis
MSMQQDWSTSAFDLAPVAPAVGPFPGRDWLQTWWNYRATGDLILEETGDSLVALTFDNNRVEFAGEADLTDYHSPLGSEDVAALAKAVVAVPIGAEVRLDSLPIEAAERVAVSLASIGLESVTTRHTVTAVLELPDSFDEYLAGLGKKERHEMRRKRRRFDNEIGPGSVERRSGTAAVELFADLHRRSAGDKGAFMTSDMEEFFGALHTAAGGVIDVLVDGTGRPASAVFSFEDSAGFYLYNSAFEPEVMHLSPGNVMLSHLIERAIDNRHRVFDFLKGDETYKFRLGAQPRPLFVVETATGGNR